MAQLAAKIARTSLKLVGAKEQKRQYEGAKISRLTNDWTTTNSSANQEIKMSLRVMRARARQLARDDDYFKGYVDKLITNVVGQKGIKLESNATDAEGNKIDALNKPLTAAWSKWGRKEFASSTGTESWRDIQALALRTEAVDGECIIQTIFDPSNVFGFSLHFIDADWLDEDYNDPQLPNGNRVIMSIEVDAWNKPIAYYFTPPRWNNIFMPDYPGNLGTKQTDRTRIPADQIIHLFRKTRPGQVRGMTWAHTAMMRLNMLNGYEEAELIGQRVGASMSAYVIPPAGDFVGRETPDDIEQEVQAGMLQSLPAGYDLKIFDPKRPGTTYGAFVKQILRGIAVGLNISYNSLSSDLESTSYSSIRSGSLEDRDGWRSDQESLAEHLCQAVFEKWLFWNINTDELSVPTSAFDQLSNPTWRGRGFDWVDPLKDGKADIEANNAGLKTKTEILAERGLDFEEVMKQFQHEAEVEKKLNLAFGVAKDALLQMDIINATADQADQAAQQSQSNKAAA